MSDISAEQLGKLANLLGREFAAYVRDRTVESHYSAERAAELLEVTVRTIWNYVDQYETSGGKAGLGPVVKLSHKVVRIPASSINRLLKSRLIAAPPAEDLMEAKA